ncbi:MULTISPECIES: MliC family protein [unclassified Pseudoalteromonas]|uniref:MliC family protein n=1 Tax=unclassified Pseudoalteromonas TaxID=194690 RepID=UPI003867E4BD
MKLHLAFIISLLSLIACSDKQLSTLYSCDANTLIIKPINDEKAKLTFNNQTYSLNYEKSASGNKYINGNILFWSKGDNAMLIIAGKKHQCSIN